MSSVWSGRQLVPAYQKLEIYAAYRVRERWSAAIRIEGPGWKDGQNGSKSGHRKNLRVAALRALKQLTKSLRHMLHTASGSVGVLRLERKDLDTKMFREGQDRGG